MSEFGQSLITDLNQAVALSLTERGGFRLGAGSYHKHLSRGGQTEFRSMSAVYSTSGTSLISV